MERRLQRPPSAIRITLTFYRKGGDDLPDKQSEYQHLVAIPAGITSTEPSTVSRM